MKRKAKGTRAELRSRDYLQKFGWRVARFAGSFGPFDLIAFGERSILLVQVKCGRLPTSRELRAMRDFPAPRNCKKVIHRWKAYASEPETKEV